MRSGPAPAPRVSRTPSLLCYSGRGGAGRSGGPAGAGGAWGRPERVGDTAWGGGGAAAAPRPGKKSPGVASAPGASGEETRAPSDQHHLPAATRLLCALAALRATAPPRAPAPAGRHPRGPPPRPPARPPRLGRPWWRHLAPTRPAPFPGLGPSSEPSTVSAPARPRLCRGVERLSECPPT